jgi:MFS family permease
MALQDTFRALRHRNYRLFFAGQIISLVGTWMQNIAISWLVYRLTQNEFILGLTAFCTNVPVLFLGPLGGLMADRYSRHRIVVVAQFLFLIQAIVLAVLTLSDRITVPAVLILGVLLGIVNAFEIPARQSLLVQLASKEDLLSAISLNSVTFNGARVLGPAVAGILVAAVGEGWCFAINAVSFLAVIGSLLAMRLPPRLPVTESAALEHLVDGFRYVRSSPRVRSVLLLIAAATIAAMPIMVLAPFFADAIFHRGSLGLGLLSGSFGIGAVIGTLTLAGRGHAKGLTRIIFYSTSGLSICMALFSLSPSFGAALCSMLGIGFFVMRQNAAANTSVQTSVADEFRGRIMAFYSMTVVGLSPFGSLAAGALASYVGPRLTVAAGSAVCIFSALAFRYALKHT